LLVSFPVLASRATHQSIRVAPLSPGVRGGQIRRLDQHLRPHHAACARLPLVAHLPSLALTSYRVRRLCRVESCLSATRAAEEHHHHRVAAACRGCSRGGLRVPLPRPPSPLPITSTLITIIITAAAAAAAATTTCCLHDDDNDVQSRSGDLAGASPHRAGHHWCEVRTTSTQPLILRPKLRPNLPFNQPTNLMSRPRGQQQFAVCTAHRKAHGHTLATPAQRSWSGEFHIVEPRWPVRFLCPHQSDNRFYTCHNDMLRLCSVDVRSELGSSLQPRQRIRPSLSGTVYWA